MNMLSLKLPGYYVDRLQHHGFGRVVRRHSRRLGLPAGLSNGMVRAAKIGAAPGEWFERRRLARQMRSKMVSDGPLLPSTGFRVFQPGEFEGVQRVVAAGQDLFERRHDEFKACADQDISFNLFSAGDLMARSDVYDLTLAQEILNFAVSEPLVRGIADYLGEVPILGNVDLRASGPSDKTEAYQLFHVDMEDVTQVKVFIAINDIEEDSGPTTIVSADRTEQIRRQNRHEFGRLSDGEVLSHTQPQDVIRLTGKAGIMAMVDTSRCLHFGSRTRSGIRLLLKLQYLSYFNLVEPPMQLARVNYDSDCYAANPLAHRLLARCGR